jgi:type IV pilus assembly protein PilY1
VLSALNTTSGEDLFFHVMGTDSLAGSFCVDDDPNADIQNFASGSCQDGTDASSHPEQRFVIHVALNTQPTGVIQDLGDKARFGLLEFRTSGDGGRVLTPIGSELSLPLDAGGGTAATPFNNNKAAMLTSIDGPAPVPLWQRPCCRGSSTSLN